MYDGKTDPVEHLNHYQRAMALYSHNNAQMCQAFSNTLIDTALSWFNKLLPRLVTSFADLGVKFINQFLTSKKIKKEHVHFVKGQVRGRARILTMIQVCEWNSEQIPILIRSDF